MLSLSQGALVMSKATENKVTIYIDDKPYEVSTDNNLLAGVLSQNLNLPYFCWHPSMGSVAACRQCAVTQYQDENDERGRLVMACTTPVTDGMRIGLGDKSSSKFREQVITAMMTNHPHDCPVCAEGGECHLQDMTVMTGHSVRTYKGQKRTYQNQHLGEFVGHEMNRCITCYRCVRFYKDYAGGEDFGVYGSRNKVYFGRQSNGQLESEFSGNLVEVCPTGVFTNKLFSAHFTRKWDLQSAPSICSHCSVGCNTSVGERYGSVRRVVNRFNDDINGYFLCDVGRFGIGFVNNLSRIRTAKGIAQQSPLGLSELDVAKALVHYRHKKFAAIGSSRASLEANAYLQSLVGLDKFSVGLAKNDLALAKIQSNILTKFDAPSIKQIEASDFVLIVAEDITQTSPRIALAVRQALKNVAIKKADLLGIPSWQDSAVRTIGGEDKTPMYALQSTPTKLDKESKYSDLLSPQTILLSLDFILARVAEQSTKDFDLTEDQISLLEQLTNEMLAAKSPLIVSGWSHQNALILSKVEAIASALKARNEQSDFQLCVLAPSANSVGVMSLMNEDTPSVEALISLSKNNDIDGIIVLENTLEWLSESELSVLKDNVEVLIALDHSENQTTEIADIVLPAATVTEGDGHFVNYQGYIQRFYQVHVVDSPIRESWHWINSLAQSLFNSSHKLTTFTALTRYLGEAIDGWLIKADSDSFSPETASGIPRQTHRNSGRTSQSANITVHEGKSLTSCQQVNENEPQFNFSMEGHDGSQCQDVPFSWAPGWNSNQSINQGSLHQSDKTYEKVSFAHCESQSLADDATQQSEGLLFVRQPRCFNEDWQARLNPEFGLMKNESHICVASKTLDLLDVEQSEYLKITLSDENDTAEISHWVAKLVVDDELPNNLSYGQLANNLCGKTGISIQLSIASEEEVKEFKHQETEQQKHYRNQQAQMLSQLKERDQFIPIRMSNDAFYEASKGQGGGNG